MRPEPAYALIEGDRRTYEVRNQLASMGCWWDPDEGSWHVPLNRLDEAYEVIEAAEAD